MSRINPVALNTPISRSYSTVPNSKKSIASYLGSSFVLASALIFGGKTHEAKAQELQTNSVVRKAEDDFDFRKAYIEAERLIEAKKYFSVTWLIQESFFDREKSIMYHNGEIKRTRTVANELLEKIPQKYKDEYFGEESVIGKRAKRDLETAVEKGDINLVKKVWKQYPYTPAGKEAAYLSIYIWLDRGDYENLYSFFADEVKSKYLLDYEPLSQAVHFHAAHFFAQIGDQENLLRITEDMLKKNPNDKMRMGDDSYDVRTIVSKLREYTKGNEEWKDYLRSYKLANDLRDKNILNGHLDEQYVNSPVVFESNLQVDSPENVTTTVVDNGNLIISSTKNGLHAFKLEDRQYKEIARKTFKSVFSSSKPAPVVIRNGNEIQIVALLETNYIYLLSLEDDGFKILDMQFFTPTGCNSLVLLPKEESSEKRRVVASSSSSVTELVVYGLEGNKLKETQKYNVGSRYSKPALIAESNTLLIAKYGGSLEVLRFQEDELKKVTESRGFVLEPVEPTMFPDNKTMSVISQREVYEGDSSVPGWQRDTVRVLRLENDEVKEIDSTTEIGYWFRSTEISSDGKMLVASASHNNDPALFVYKFENDKLIKVGTFKTDFGGAWVYPYKPTFLSDNKIISFPCDAGKVYILKITDDDLKKVSEIDLIGELRDPGITKILNDNSNESDLLLVGNNLLRFFNLTQPKSKLDYSFFEMLKK